MMAGVDGKGATSSHCKHVAPDLTRPVYVTGLHFQVCVSNKESFVYDSIQAPSSSPVSSRPMLHHLIDESVLLPGTAVLSSSFHMLLSHVGRIAIAVLSETDVAANRMHSI